MLHQRFRGIVCLWLALLFGSETGAFDTGQVHLYNTISQCKSSTEFFDVEHFKCRPCNAAAGLKVADNRK